MSLLPQGDDMIMALNAVDSTGVHKHVIARVQQWRQYLEKVDDHNHAIFKFYTSRDTTGRDTEYIVQCLQAAAVQPPPEEPGVSSTRPRKKTGLQLSSMTDEAMAVFCAFLQSPDAPVETTLTVESNWILQQVLHALLANTFVKELNIERIYGHPSIALVANMLQHKSELTSLCFSVCTSGISAVHRGLCRRHAHLQTLSFDFCHIDDYGTHSILTAMTQGDFPVLKSFRFNVNCITGAGLRCLAELGPVALRHVQKLVLDHNNQLLEDAESTRLFVQTILLSNDMSVKELSLERSCRGPHVTAIIQACEHVNCKLQVLDILSPYSHPGDPQRRHHQTICDQLIKSLPKMSKLERLTWDSSWTIPGSDVGEINIEKNRLAIITALHQNTSVFVLETRGAGYDVDDDFQRKARPILDRNQKLKHADTLLALQPNTHMPIRLKSEIWSRALAKMGEEFCDDDTDASSPDFASSGETQGSEEGDGAVNNSNNNNRNDQHSVSYGGYTGASAIFKILQKRPGILEKQLRRPTGAALVVINDTSDGGMQKDSSLGGQKRKNVDSTTSF
jgi:hypothetical protein